MIDLRCPQAIPTLDSRGVANGYLLPIWNSLEDDWRPDQVYVTAVYPGAVKGPHLHLTRKGRFCCIHGAVWIVTRDAQGRYHQWPTGSPNFTVVHVPAGMPAAIYNQSNETALVLNMPSPAWSPADPDEHPVVDWDFQL